MIFVCHERDWNPPLGDYLGELTSEIPPDEHITEFVSAGPKTYRYKLFGGKVCWKVKGITLNVANSEKVNFETLRDLVLDHGANPAVDTPKTIVIQQRSIVRNKSKWTIETKTLRKMQRVSYDKRVLTENFNSLPCGF